MMLKNRLRTGLQDKRKQGLRNKPGSVTQGVYTQGVYSEAVHLVKAIWKCCKNLTG